jgi:RNA polymerase sigma factor (sigma-70 family)
MLCRPGGQLSTKMNQPGQHAGGGVFPQTQHSVVERLRSGHADIREGALETLVEAYWKPVYKHLRLKWRLAPEDAEDLTQGFFLGAIEKGWLSDYDPGKALFRTFVRLCADRHVMNWQQSEGRRKRGGGASIVSLDFPGAESELARVGMAAPDEADAFFRQEFVRAVFERAIEAVRRECADERRDVAFRVFERYEIDAPDGTSYASLAAEFGLTTTQVTNHLAHVRRRFRQHALDTLRALSGSPEHFRDDARAIFGVVVE